MQRWSSIWTFLLLTAAPCLAQTGLNIQLVSEVTSIQPGRPFYAGLFIHHEPLYHTYWKQPGIVGVPTSMRWELPAGFTADELEFPEPESVLMFRIKAQGYERDVLIQARITPPKDLQPGTQVRLAGMASWMCCANTCHPGHKHLEITLPVTSTAPAWDEKWHPVFEQEKFRFPASTNAWTATASEDGMEVLLTLTPASPQARISAAGDSSGIKVIFFTEDGWINSDEPQTVEVTAKGGFAMRLRRADVFLGRHPPELLAGVVQREGGWLAPGTLRSLRIAPKIQRQQPLVVKPES